MPEPENPKLYESTKRYVKNRVKVWPSAYASAQLVRRYKKLGGEYKKSSFGKVVSGLIRWFKEKWVNVCGTKINGKYPKCSRTSKKYPYCRPSVRVTSKTPKTVHELSTQTIKRRCRKKISSKRI